MHIYGIGCYPDLDNTETCGDRHGQLRDVLDGYAKFLQGKKLALDKQQPYLVRWVREFLLFARARSGYSFEQMLDLLSGRSGRACGHEAMATSVGVRAIRIYHYQCRGAKAGDVGSQSAQAVN